MSGLTARTSRSLECRENMNQVAGVTDAEPSVEAVRMAILATQREGSRRLQRRLRSAGLNTLQGEILVVLSQAEPITLRQLAELLTCDSGGPSRAVDALVRSGFVTRRRARVDRRKVYLTLTNAGRRTATEVIKATRELDELLLSRLSAQERTTIWVALRKLLADTHGQDILDRRF